MEKLESGPLASALELTEKLIFAATALNGPLGVQDRGNNPKNAIKLDMITGLHEKGCTAAREILALLRVGLADGALSRWRSLYEIEVIAGFIASQGPSTAERYRDHAAIKNWEAISSVAAFEPIDTSTLAGFERKRDEVVQKYGTKFKQEYGWAADVVGLSKRSGPNRGDLERTIGKEKWGPLYKAASYQVHPTANAVIGFMGTGIQSMALPGIFGVSSLKALSHIFIDVCVPERQRPGIKQHIEDLANEAGEAFSMLP